MQTWDPYTRIWHWLLMLGIIFQYISGEILDDQIQNHALVGYGLLGMMTFRVLWGVIGPETIRFATFIPTPTHLLTYITGKKSTPYATHNPLGALAVLGFIVIIFIQSLSGLFMTDDIFFTGPLHSWLTGDITDIITRMHDWAFNLLLLFVVIHIAAVLYHRFTTEPYIIKAMLTGHKPIAHKYQTLTTLQLHLRAWLCILISTIKIVVLINYVPEWLGIEDELWY